MSESYLPHQEQTFQANTQEQLGIEQTQVTETLGEQIVADTVAVEPVEETAEKPESYAAKLSHEQVSIVNGFNESLLRVNGERSTPETRSYTDQLISAGMQQAVKELESHPDESKNLVMGMMAQGLGAATNQRLRESIAEEMIKQDFLNKEDLSIVLDYISNMHRLANYTEDQTIPFTQMYATAAHQIHGAVKRAEMTGDKRLHLAVTTATMGLAAVSDQPMMAYRISDEMRVFAA